MRSRFFSLAFGAALAVVFAMPAPAQETGREWVHPPRTLPKGGHGHGAVDLNTLFDALKIAPDAASAKAIEERIWAAWAVSGSDTCNLLMTRVKVAAEEKEYDLAIKLLNAIVAIKPNYIEAYNERATIFFLKDDIAHALADLRQVLKREPRHFGALAGLGLILQELGDDRHALEAYRRALAIDPHLAHVGDVVKELTVKVEGRDI